MDDLIYLATTLAIFVGLALAILGLERVSR
jgi:hypothetical protein